jgi:HD superfamily phosphohydrolase
MKKSVCFFSVILLLALACKQKKSFNNNQNQKESFFPVLSFIKSQVAHIDTSLYPIKKIIFTDSTYSDTVFVPREEFLSLAKDFLEIPDLTDKKYEGRYTEEKLFDETLNRIIISYKPQNPDKEELQKQEILIAHDPSGDKVNSIIIDRVISNKDSFLQKSMLWQVDKSFQVTTTAQKPGQPEITTIMKITWGEDEH